MNKPDHWRWPPSPQDAEVARVTVEALSPLLVEVRTHLLGMLGKVCATPFGISASQLPT